MRKSTKIGRRLVALFLVLLLSIDNFAAVVGDNDGAAFITKAEFDSLKNTFQAEINRYNNSLDNKIDGAIASYLAGIKIAKETILKLPVSSDSIKNLYWFKEPKVYGTLRTWSNETTYTDRKAFVDPPADDRFAFDANSEMRVLGNTIGLGGGVWWALSFSLNQTVAQRRNSRYYVVRGWDSRNSWPSTLHLRLQDSNKYIRTRTDSTGWWRNWIYYCWAHLGSYNSESFVRLSDSANQGWYWPYTQGVAPSTNASVSAVYENQPLGSHDFINGRIYFDANGYRNNNEYSGYFPIKSDARGLDLWPTWLSANSGLMPYSGNYARNTSSWTNISDHIPEVLLSEGLHDFIFGDGTTNSFGNQSTAWNRMMLGDNSKLKINVTRYNEENQTLDGRSQRIVEKANYTDINCYVSSVMCGSNRVAWTPNRTSTIDPGNRISGLTIPITLHVPGNEQMKVQEIENGYTKYANSDNYLKIGQGIPIATNVTEKGDVTVKIKYTINRVINITGTQTNLRKILFDARKKDFLTGFRSETDLTFDDDSYFYASIGDSTTENKADDLELNVAAGKEATFTIHDVTDEDQVWLRFKPQTTDGGYYVRIDSIEAKFKTGD